MSAPLVSICIPTHNRLRLFKVALQSAQCQTYGNIEIVISDNSDDNLTQTYVSGLKDKRIKYFKCGKSSSFVNINNVAQLAKGKYIKYLLDDDILMPECVESMVTILEENQKVGVVTAPLKIIDEDGNEINPTFYMFRKMKYLYKYMNKNSYVNRHVVLNDFLTNIYPCCVPTGIMFRKSLFQEIKGFNESFSFISDVELCMNFATKMDFYYTNDFLSAWRFSSSSETVSILHNKGLELEIFYKLTKKYLPYAKNLRKAYFFASKRTALNIVAGVHSKNLNLIFETVKTILYNDPYLSNKLLLPFNLVFEVIKSLFII